MINQNLTTDKHGSHGFVQACVDPSCVLIHSIRDRSFAKTKGTLLRVPLGLM